ncbi:MAG: hypothetical protein OXH57_06915 [Ekhidna sp.]|nr:hypothetical protein [Ekhidna sp.]
MSQFQLSYKLYLEKEDIQQKMPKSVLGLWVGWIDFGRFGDPIVFSPHGHALLRFFLFPVVDTTRMECPAWNVRRGTWKRNEEQLTHLKGVLRGSYKRHLEKIF